MNIEERVSVLRNRINKGLTELFEEKSPESLYAPMKHLLDAGGKRLRPLLVIFTCEAAGGTVEKCFNASLAIELMHTFTLVHDDIMDNDDTRRGTPSVHKKWDIPTAILAGDGLVTLAYQVLLNTESSRINEVLKSFTNGLLILCEGQALDKDLENREKPSLDSYMEMISKKTGKLIEVCCDIGAILGGADNNDRVLLKEFGSRIGRAFQIQDDVLDIFSGEKITGKPVASDIIQKKNTYLTVHLWNSGNKKIIKRFASFWGRQQLSQSDIDEIRRFFRETGSLESAKEIINNDLDYAVKIIQSLKCSVDKTSLKYIVDILKDRSY